jgi:hypothetical protein
MRGRAMHRYTRAVWLALALASVFAMWPASASATRLSVNRREIRMIWNEMTFRNSSGERVTCAITLEGTLEASTFTKVINLRMGVIYAAVSSCSSTIRFLTETSWDIRYETFFGTLPEIRNLLFKITGFAFNWAGFFYDCLYRSELSRPLLFNATRNPATWQLTRVDPVGGTNRLPPFRGALCTNARDEVTLSGSGTISKQGEGEGIFVTLIG